MVWNKLIITLILTLLGSAIPGSRICIAAEELPEKSSSGISSVLRTKAVRQGMAIELSVEPVVGLGEQKLVREGEYANMSIQVRDATTGAPVTSMYPAVWVDQRKEFAGDKNPQPLTCSDKIKSYLKGALSYRPDIDLNSYYILALNNDATISVIDPIMGVAGYSQMFKMILLRSPGGDWTMGRDGKTMLVTMPKAGQVALVDLEQLTVRENLPAGEMPTRIVLQPDARYVWVSNDAPGAAGGVTVLHGERGNVVARIATAGGGHDIALADDSLTAYVVNRDAGTVTVIDTQTLQRVKELKTGSRPWAIAYSRLSKSAYVVDELDGTITVIDGTNFTISRVIREDPGLSTIRFAPGERWGFVLNRRTNQALVLDVATNAIQFREPVGLDPEQVTFSSAFAYVRSRGTAEVTLLALDSIGKGDRITGLKVSGGSRTPSESTYTSPDASSIAITPEGNSVVIASPSDATIIYYMEGMGVPMGSFKNAGRIPRALTTLNRSLRETRPGVYNARIKIPRSGTYDVMFLLDSPRITECFSFTAEANPILTKLKTEHAINLEFMLPERRVKTGVPVTIRVRASDEGTGKPLVALTDLVALPTLTPYGNWQQRFPTKGNGTGVYEFSFTPPESGLYNIYFSTGNLRFTQLPYLSLQAVQ